ncbi:hypothetical protein ACFSPU_05640 [Haoranjiania flava]|uniref:Uncharacterized protein n=1 Tax=Haoranjiania flava TaxID=1856322 RepID=A0AAE3LJX3_9BACT|nr:hypothetical protein [Haoranjiania flava]MCU7693809.1 hypothetical protein [Haoranjiania flava]
MVLVIDKTTKREDIDKLLKARISKQKKNGFDAAKFCGLIKLKEQPMDIQKKMRDEWQ